MANLKSTDLIVVAESKPGTVTFGNYDQLKAELERGLQYYNACEYTIENIDVATANREELKTVKKVLEAKKKEIEAAYQAPYLEVVKKLDERNYDIIKARKAMVVKHNKNDVKENWEVL